MTFGPRVVTGAGRNLGYEQLRTRGHRTGRVRRVARVAASRSGRPVRDPSGCVSRARTPCLDGDVVFRTAPGEKLIAAALEREVVFEVDSFSAPECSGWSVNVLGVAAEIVHPAELGQAEALDLPSWAGDVRDRYVRIRAREVSGRRILPPALAPRAPSGDDMNQRDGARGVESSSVGHCSVPELRLGSPRSSGGVARAGGALPLPRVQSLLGRRARIRSSGFAAELPRLCPNARPCENVYAADQGGHP